jgi:uncharacterized DUF497 family protein
MTQTFVWDERKREANLRKHSIDFRDAAALFEGTTVTIEDDRFEYEERRFLTLGLLRGHVILVVYTEQANALRIISARKATPYERENYFRYLTD